MSELNEILVKGLSPYNTGEENSAILQQAADCGGNIRIEEAGEYPVSKTVLLGDHTHLFFGEGVTLRRELGRGGTGYVFANRGAFTGECNRDISIDGLRLLCNMVNSDNGEDCVPGLRGHLSFFHVEDLHITHIAITQMPAQDFGIHICDFKRIVLEDLWIEGKKDAVHLGCGQDFEIHRGDFRTYDDPIALNAHDYATSNPMLGWIENGVIEDCRDLDDDSTVGFFCRILAGAWKHWEAGMTVQHSDTVVNAGRLYRVYMQPDSQTYRSMTPPTHEKGFAVLDGIRWLMVQEGELTNCGCRNVLFRNIRLMKKRPIGFSLHFDKDRYSRSYYPFADAPVQSGIVFENVTVENDMSMFLHCRTPIDKVVFSRCDFKNTALVFEDVGTEGIVYPMVDIEFCGIKPQAEPEIRHDPSVPVQVRKVVAEN